MNSVSREIFGGIVYATEASVVWADLKERFDKVNGSRIFALHRDIGRLVQGNDPISAYFSKLKQLWDEFSSLVSLPSCDCDTTRTYAEHDQQLKLLQFLMGLNESYTHVRSQMLMMTPLPSVGQAFSIISHEESRRSLVSVSPPAHVFYSTQNKSSSKPPDSRRDLLKCEYCHWTGHLKKNCYRLVGYPPGHRLYHQQSTAGTKKHNIASSSSPKVLGHVNNVTESSVPHSPPIFTSDQYAEILKLLGANTIASPTDPVANMAGIHSPRSFSDWIIDTGANAYMTGFASLLHSSKPVANSKGTVKLPNGGQLLVTQVGTVTLSPSLQTKNTYKPVQAEPLLLHIIVGIDWNSNNSCQTNNILQARMYNKKVHFL